MEITNRVVNRPAPYSSLMPEARQHDTFGNQGGLGERGSRGPSSIDTETEIKLYNSNGVSNDYIKSVQKLEHNGLLDEDVELPVESLALDDDELIFHYIGWRYRDGDESTPQMYQIIVANEHGEKSEFVKLLKEIDCESCFVACSVDYPDMFFAELNKSEAAKLKGVHGIKDVIKFTSEFTHC